MLCGGCDKCAPVRDASIVRFDEVLAFEFQEGMAVDQSREVSAEWFHVPTPRFVDAVREFYSEQDSGGLMPLEQLFSGAVDLKRKPQNRVFLYYTSEEIKGVSILGKKLNLSDFDKSDVSLNEYLQGHLETDVEGLDILSQEVADPPNATASPCALAKAYRVSLDPDDIKVGVNGVLSEPVTLVVVCEPKCQEGIMDSGSLIKEVSISLGSILVSNLFKEIVFSAVNSKDLLDIVRFDSVTEPPEYAGFEDFFSTFDCNHFPSFGHTRDSLDSNLRIKSLLIGGFESPVNPRLLGPDERDWFAEYLSQLNSRFSGAVLGTFDCKYKLVLSEYIILVLLGVHALLWLGRRVSALLVAPPREPKGHRVSCCGQAAAYLYMTFFNSLLLVYFYNLVAFCGLLAHVKSLAFGLVDFVLMVARGSVVTFPLIEFFGKVSLPSGSTGDKPRTLSRPSQKKTRQQQHHKFTTRLRKKRVHASWARRKRRIDAVVRISFDRSAPYRKKRKDITLRYKLEVVDTPESGGVKEAKGESVLSGSLG